MGEDKIITGESFSKDHDDDDEIPIGQGDNDSSKKRKYDLAGTSVSSEFTHEQWKNMFDQNSHSSSEEEMEIKKRNDDKKLRDNESFIERMHKKIEAAFNGSDSDDDEPSQDPDFQVHTNVEGLADELCKLLSNNVEELKESKGENDDIDLK